MNNRPVGYNQMIQVFGDIRPFILEDGGINPQWEANILDTLILPFSMKLSWNTKLSVNKIRCHTLMIKPFKQAFGEIYKNGLEDQCQYFGGCYTFRAQRGAKYLSTHCWAIAIDLNPDTNQMGTPGDMSPDIIKIFCDCGFVYGGNFSRKDPMHFQFVEGY